MKERKNILFVHTDLCTIETYDPEKIYGIILFHFSDELWNISNRYNRLEFILIILEGDYPSRINNIPVYSGRIKLLNIIVQYKKNRDYRIIPIRD